METSLDGQSVYAATGGRPFEPARPTIIFLHGAGMDHSVWALQTRYFAHRGLSVLALDLPGHGRSGGDPLTSIEDLGAWVLRLQAALGLKQAALVGHSMGALIALEAAGSAPERCSALALLGAAPQMPVHPDLLAAAAANEPRALGLICDWGHGPTGHRGGNRAPGLWLLGGGIRLLEKARPGVLACDLEACNAYQQSASRGPAVRAPALVLSGALDKMTPAKAGGKLAALLPRGIFQALPGAGHMMMLEQPDETLDSLRGFLQSYVR
ncbi:MAG: alpha/beta hydrolase [Pseudomonadota bacterium]